MVISDEVARRLEAAEAIDAAACAEAVCQVQRECGAAVSAIAGGVATYCGAVSPLTHALGMGMHGRVTESDIDEIEEFFLSRGAGVSIDVCPHADATLRDLLSQRGYRIAEMNNVLVRDTRNVDTSANAGIVVAEASDEREYATTVTCGFFGREIVTDDEFLLGRTLFHTPCTTALIARIDGVAAGACGISLRNGVASFWGDATLSAFRGRGVHTAMIAERLRRALAAGCDLATAGTQPGSASQRNYQRLGFEVAYTKLTMIR